MKKIKDGRGKELFRLNLFVETCALALAFVTTQRDRGPRDLGSFHDDEDKHSLRKYFLKTIYDGSEVAWYDQLRLTK